MKNRMEEVIETFNYEGLLELLEAQYGKKFMLKTADLLYLWYCVQRKHVRENRNDMIKFLDKNNILEDKRHILSTIDRYFSWRNHLPDLKESIHKRLDRANQYLNPIVPFQQIGNRMLGIVDDMNKESYSVVDISEGRENKVAVIFKKGGISWRNDNLHPFQMKWIVEQNKITKKGVLA